MEEIRYLNDGSIVLRGEEGIYSHQFEGSLALVMDEDEGEKLFNEGREMKVFKMDDMSWVAHFSVEEAKEFYMSQTGTSEIEFEECFEGEVSLDNTMYWDEKDISKEDMETFKFELHSASATYGDLYEVPLKWVINRHPFNYPDWIAVCE